MITEEHIDLLAPLTLEQTNDNAFLHQLAVRIFECGLAADMSAARRWVEIRTDLARGTPISKQMRDFDEALSKFAQQAHEARLLRDAVIERQRYIDTCQNARDCAKVALDTERGRLAGCRDFESRWRGDYIDLASRSAWRLIGEPGELVLRAVNNAALAEFLEREAIPVLTKNLAEKEEALRLAIEDGPPME